MPRFLLLMYDDSTMTEDPASWGPYLARLRESGRFDGGSSIGGGASHRRLGPPGTGANHLVGYLVVHAADADDAVAFLDGNPVYEAGGTVEIRELLVD